MKKLIAGSYAVLMTVVCFAEESTGKKDVTFFRGAVSSAAQGFNGDKEGSFENVRKHAKKCNLTQEDAIAEMSALAREYRRNSEKTLQVKTLEEEARDDDARRCLRILQLISCFGDRSTLPLFEEMSAASNTWVRQNAYVGYIKVAGVDSVPFIKKALEDERLNSVDHGRIYELFGKQIELATQKGNINIEPCQRFLLEETKKEHTGDGGKQLDIILNRVIPDYTNSIQRVEAAEWFIQNGSGYHKNYFGNIKTEIEKTPKEKRKDFKAKGEILDPDRVNDKESGVPKEVS